MLRRPVLVLVTLLLGVTAVQAQIPQAEFAQRRSALMQSLGEGVLISYGSSAAAADYLPFAQRSNFRYLTGVTEEDAILVMTRRGGSTSAMLFVQPKDPAQEVWSGIRLGAEGAQRATGMTARTLDGLQSYVDSLLRMGGTLFVDGDLRAAAGETAHAAAVRGVRERHPTVTVQEANAAIRRLRGTKSPAELAEIRRAVDITVIAHREAMRVMEPGLNEFEVQALIEYTFRRYGAERPAFSSIVGSGPNSTTLHYRHNDRFMQDGDVVVIDIGASYRGYAADVTRTLPVNGRFSPAQREIYQIVRDAQASAERQARIGISYAVLSDSARVVIANGLARVGLVESADATVDAPPGTCGNQQVAQCPQWRLYYMHGLGHGIGLDVHDPDQYQLPPNRIDVGSAFSIEPGIYVRANLASILPDTPRNRATLARIRPAIDRFANIGVRIEDDYIVTSEGLQWISQVPREIDEIEKAMAEPYSGPSPRRGEIVDWYRVTP